MKSLILSNLASSALEVNLAFPIRKTSIEVKSVGTKGRRKERRD
jgi:hypothetical protein